jgi:hypothetical protein
LFNTLIIDRAGANRAARPRDESLVVEADKYALAIIATSPLLPQGEKGRVEAPLNR